MQDAGGCKQTGGKLIRLRLLLAILWVGLPVDRGHSPPANVHQRQVADLMGNGKPLSSDRQGAVAYGLLVDYHPRGAVAASVDVGKVVCHGAKTVRPLG